MSGFPPPRVTARPRIAWIAGTRGEILLLGPLFQHYIRRSVRNSRPGEPLSWLLTTGEHGMAAWQALDLLNLVPDEAGELCHPADEPAVRLGAMLARAEAFVRQRKATHVVFAGFGPTAAGAALY
ncbi:MAG: hypothetical protein M1457_11575, partial [bacterium]|nr:hypothetical protein [bacterium]